jgi:uncharacterized membrane protein YphA (DoxX/SURF4 family)
MKKAETENVAFAAARTLLVATFVVSAINHLTHWTAALDEMTGLGMPRSGILMAGSIVLRLTGGLLVLTGIRGRLGAASCFRVPRDFSRLRILDYAVSPATA